LRLATESEGERREKASGESVNRFSRRSTTLLIECGNDVGSALDETPDPVTETDGVGISAVDDGM